jgi:membrane dipeptidase
MRPLFATLFVFTAALHTGCCKFNTLEERIRNRHTEPRDAQPSEAALKLVRENPPIDLHADSLLWSRNLLEESELGHADIPRWQKGNFGTQVFSTVSHAAFGTSQRVLLGGFDIFNIHCLWNCWPAKTLTSRLQRVLYQTQKFHNVAKESAGKLVPITTRHEFAAHNFNRARTQAVGGILSVEGAQALDDNLANLDVLINEGVRILGLVHLVNNTFAASSSLGNTDTGLSSRGEELVRLAQKKGLLLDLAHSSPRTIDAVLAISPGPHFVTHTGLMGACPNARNLNDAQAKSIADNGGLIGIAFFKDAVCGEGIEHIAKSILHAREVVGIHAIALGSDFDGSVTVAVRANNIALLADALLGVGLTEKEIGLVLSGNAKQFFEKNLPESFL